MSLDPSIERLFPQRGNFSAKFWTPRLRDLVVKEGVLLGGFGVNRKRILDVGCGDGRISARLTRGFECVPDILVLFENEAAPLARARENLSRDTGLVRRIHAVQGDLFAMPFVEGNFDLVIAFGDVPSLCWRHPAEAMAALRPLLAPDGVILFSVIAWEYLEKLALRDRGAEMAAQVGATGWLPVSDDGSFGIPHVGLCRTPEIDENLSILGYRVLHRMETRFDFDDVPARILCACAKR